VKVKFETIRVAAMRRVMEDKLTGAASYAHRDRQLRALYQRHKDPALVAQLQLVYMAAEAGVDAPLAALTRLADLIRADVRSEFQSKILALRSEGGIG
jgi:hypothetical protein